MERATLIAPVTNYRTIITKNSVELETRVFENTSSRVSNTPFLYHIHTPYETYMITLSAHMPMASPSIQRLHNWRNGQNLDSRQGKTKNNLLLVSGLVGVRYSSCLRFRRFRGLHCRIQRTWRHVTSLRRQQKSRLRSRAAVVIQAAWRGYSMRLRIQRVGMVDSLCLCLLFRQFANKPMIFHDNSGHAGGPWGERLIQWPWRLGYGRLQRWRVMD